MSFSFYGPRCWLLSALTGTAAGLAAAWMHGPLRLARPDAAVPAWLMTPFILLLAGIAVMPLLHAHFWEKYYPDVAFLLGSFTTAYWIAARAGGETAMLHTAVEYGQFMALVGGLFVVSGGILIDVRSRGRPLANTLLLGAGAVLANLVGTTGASMLLIRPFLRINHGRIRPFHVVFFIMIVSNCGGCLTPLGDPPLFLGYLKGIPFTWTLLHLWPEWLAVNLALLAAFFCFDRRVPAAPATAENASENGPVFRISGWSGMICLGLLLGALLLDGLLKHLTGLHTIPFGALAQVAVAVAAIRLADKDILRRNQFMFAPVREVGFLFAGIFATMVPALAWLQQHAAGFGLESTAGFYFLCGALSSVLDNAPTYLSFLQTAFALVGVDMQPASVSHFLDATYTLHAGTPAETVLSGAKLLKAVSLGAVFFGAMTYIGNGPNFMVKAIAESAGVRTPSFLGYLGYSLLILLPILTLAFLLL